MHIALSFLHLQTKQIPVTGLSAAGISYSLESSISAAKERFSRSTTEKPKRMNQTAHPLLFARARNGNRTRTAITGQGIFLLLLLSHKPSLGDVVVWTISSPCHGSGLGVAYIVSTPFISFVLNLVSHRHICRRRQKGFCLLGQFYFIGFPMSTLVLSPSCLPIPPSGQPCRCNSLIAGAKVQKSLKFKV